MTVELKGGCRPSAAIAGPCIAEVQGRVAEGTLKDIGRGEEGHSAPRSQRRITPMGLSLMKHL